MVLKKYMLIWLVLMGMATNAHAEDMWLGVMHKGGVIAPFAIYRQGKWLESWTISSAIYDAYNLEHHLPPPSLPTGPSEEVGLKSASLEYIPKDWVLGGVFPHQWYSAGRNFQYDADSMQQYEESCDVYWGVSVKNYTKKSDEDYPEFVVSSKKAHAVLLKGVDSKAEESQEILQKVFDISKKNEQAQWNQSFRTLEECQNPYLQLADTYEANYPQSSQGRYYRKQASLCALVFSGEKDVRTKHSLVNVSIKEATLQDGRKFYHISSTLRFPPIENVQKNKIYEVFSHVNFDGWFFIGKNGAIQYLPKSGRGLQCDKGEYYSHPKAIIEMGGRVFMIGEAGCYFGGYEVDAVEKDHIEEVLHRGIGGC